MRNAIKHPVLTLLKIPGLPSLTNHQPEQRTELWSHIKAFVELRKARILPPTCCCHVTPANGTFRVDPTFFIYRLWDYMTQSIYWRGSDVNSTKLKSFTPSHPPAWKHKSSFVSISTCLALHVPRCFVALCAHLFKRLPFSLHLSLSLYPSLPHPSTFPLVSFILFIFFLWDLGSHSLKGHCSALIPSSGWAPAGRMDNSSLRCRLSPPLSLLLAMRWCHGFYLLQGYPLIFSPYYTLYLPLPPCYTPIPHLFFYPFSQSLPQILSLLKRRLGDLGMFGCCLAHPRYMLDTPKGKPSMLQIQQYWYKHNYSTYWFEIPLYFYISCSCHQLVFLTGYSGVFLSHCLWS